MGPNRARSTIIFRARRKTRSGISLRQQCPVFPRIPDLPSLGVTPKRKDARAEAGAPPNKRRIYESFLGSPFSIFSPASFQPAMPADMCFTFLYPSLEAALAAD